MRNLLILFLLLTGLSSKAAEKALSAGADIVVVGNGAFENPGMLEELSLMCKKMNTEGIRV